jgi:hypothetical protein
MGQLHAWRAVPARLLRRAASEGGMAETVTVAVTAPGIRERLLNVNDYCGGTRKAIVGHG